ncbi:DNA polymerase alpha catalytic subunit isoform X2 [Parasteatoda tepidariorum]|uniref:DNA polymerase alpha catalytic subunit isoform X2 n=1 Tax=Parasteatoda tepidariorum TaxID=114398 RepID=UPI001C7248FD|nr:DNA polymerase alpha catalytic subunit isoform X2 [Parasteatoda tepidariorum]
MDSDKSEESGVRSKRTKHDKFGRFAALEKLKSLKGTKHKYEVVEESKVYEEVSEKEFSRLVQERQEEDWIIDDNGSGYVEDGREIFDDDVEGDIYTDKKNKQIPKNSFAGPQKRDVKKTNDIKNMFKSLPTKRKIEQEVKLEDDDILGSIMEDLHKEKDMFCNMPKPVVLRKKHKVNNSQSPIQRHQMNPFLARQKTPLASDYVPKTDESQKLRSVTNRKPLQPKVVDFDNNIDSGIFNEDPKDEVIEEFSQDPGFKTEIEEKNKIDIQETDSMDFDHSEDIFNDCENLLSEAISESKPVEVEANVKQTLPKDNKFFVTSSFQGVMNEENERPDVQIDSGNLPLSTTVDGQTVLRFFWLDAFEDPFKQPGTVYLFGKIYVAEAKQYVSCCVIVKDIPRRFYVLPRETELDLKTKADTGNPVSMQAVYSELSSTLQKMKIPEFRSKKSTKRYAFSVTEIPDACEYLEVQYSAKYPSLPSNLRGSTFSHVLGLDSSSLEILLLEQKIKGPCWIDVHYPQLSSPPVSWCKIEAFATKLSHIVCTDEVLPVPPVVLMCLNLTTSVHSKSQQNEVVAVSCLVHQEFPLDKTAPSPAYQSHFCVLTKPSDGIFPYDFKEAITKYKNTKVERVDSERSLLIYFLAKLQKIDPDVIVGHDVLGFDLDVLLHRLVTNKTPNWSRIGRLKRTGMPRLNIAQGGFGERNATCGRLLCDVKISSKELLRCRSYDLEELSNQILNQQFNEIPPECVHSLYSSSKQLFNLVDHGMMRSEVILRLNCELNVLPLALQITNIAGCVMSRTLLGGRSERNEFLLLHAFHAKNFIYPPKYQGKKSQAKNEEGEEVELTSKKGRKKPAYEGGLVLEPKKGFYDKYILLMDFNSLYPSIIQEYNICFTTIPRVPISDTAEEDELQVSLPDSGADPGILPAEIRKLVESRRQVKQMMKASDITKERYAQYDIRQRALKLTANSMYGCLGFTHSRFYAKPLAALITRKGREILLKTKDLVKKMCLDVIYGDTDSIMINTNQTELDEVMQLGNKVKAEINKLYKLLEIDIDGVYKPMLLLKKKKYAALSVTNLPNGQIVTKEEIKGLDIVRRDWSQLSKDAGQYIIKEILSNKSKDEIVDNIHSHLITLGEDVTQGKKPLTDYIIYKQLTKNPEEYANKKNLPHVMVAVRMNEKGAKKLKMGDTVGYIICLDGSDLPATQRAYHPDELKSNENLKIDVMYYLTQQLHPVISRLCAPIEGADAAMIAKLLGLDESKYHAMVRNVEEEEDKLLNPSSLFDDKDRFKDCDKLVLKCPSAQCFQEFIIDGPLRIEPEAINFQLDSCLKCKTRLTQFEATLRNQLEKIMKSYISRYYKLTLICDDVGCAYQTRKMPLVFSNGGPMCPSCRNSNLHLEYTESQLYNQLSYFQYMFDHNKAVSGLTDEEKRLFKASAPKEYVQLYDCLKMSTDKIVHKSAYGVVNLGTLFHGLFESNSKSCSVTK